jgi:predicted ATP-dependent endonuclease of OLD family
MASVDVVCLEEPENHLSRQNMRKLIDEICAASQSQVFVTTHSSMITSRLDLRNALLFGDKDQDPISLADLEEETAEYFMRAPTSSVLEYAMSSKVVLVEGDAEFILFPALYERATNSTLDNDRVNVISVGGLSAPRFLAIGNFLNIKTAVLTDNDENVEKCNERYEDYISEYVALFTDHDESRHTFELCLYQDNEAICENAFAEGRRTLSVQEYMLKNKSKVAYELARDNATDINVPEYITAAAQWIKD